MAKFYADESGYEQVRQLDIVLVCQLTPVEVPAAIWRKQRMAQLSDSEASVLVAAFEADYYGTADEPPRFTAVTITPQVLDDAARLTGAHGLRAYDAVQLATAMAAARVVAECRTFMAFDLSLRTSAAAEGFAVIPA